VLTFWAARALLVLHTAIGVAAVASSTHLVIWLRRYVRGTQDRRSVLKFAWWFFALQLGAFTLGVTMYPTYKVEVRTAYLENEPAFAAEQAVRDHAVGAIEKSDARDQPETADLVKRAAKASRWFDVKEHWIALGLLLSAATLLVLSLWRPEDGPAISPIVVAMATIAAGTTWLGAIIGVLSAAWRAV
jgi:hypothetical protein